MADIVFLLNPFMKVNKMQMDRILFIVGAIIIAIAIVGIATLESDASVIERLQGQDQKISSLLK
jgi:hypothetical protein